jgi:dTDP-4-amino-4,6-dideoxygalactose transaminase
MGMPFCIPVARPRLPTVAQAKPYLEAIDASRVYSNRGPLAQELEARIASHYGVAAGNVVTVANATLGLTLALLAQRVPAGSYCLMPAWTFVASAQAAQLAGVVPYLLDVSRETWALEPSVVSAAVRASRAPVGAVMVVAPFGAPVDLEPWDQLAADFGVAVVLDAAAGFDAARPSRVPAVVSLHATKALGAGEGGFVMSADEALIGRIRGASNFGFSGTREAQVPGCNAKMSEYHAAIGLAALDAWQATRGAFARVARAYRRDLDNCRGVSLQPGYGTRWVAATTVAEFDTTSAQSAARTLAEGGIDSRSWWGEGLHRHRALSLLPRAPDLSATEWLAAHTLGLPCSVDLEEEDIRSICMSLRRLVENAEADPTHPARLTRPA